MRSAKQVFDSFGAEMRSAERAVEQLEHQMENLGRQLQAARSERDELIDARREAATGMACVELEALRPKHSLRYVYFEGRYTAVGTYGRIEADTAEELLRLEDEGASVKAAWRQVLVDRGFDPDKFDLDLRRK